jgi:hypothetical protein
MMIGGIYVSSPELPASEADQMKKIAAGEATTKELSDMLDDKQKLQELTETDESVVLLELFDNE